MSMSHDLVPDLELLQKIRVNALKAGQQLEQALAQELNLEPREVVALLAGYFQMPVIETPAMLAMEPRLDRIPLVRAQQRCCALLEASTEDSSLALIAVIHDPFDADLCIWLESQARVAVEYRLASSSDIVAYLGRLEESVKAVDNMAVDQVRTEQFGKAAEVLTLAAASDAASPAVRLVSSTLYDALKAGASDIHLESTPEGLVIKLRIDGVLHHALDVQGVVLAEQAISRLKVLAELDIGERRVPQDGSFRVTAAHRDIDLRVSVMPSIHGEDAVIRILDKQAMIAAHGALTLETLGFDTNSLETLRQLVCQPHGMLLVTGPTGSGKTTTLYGAIAEIHHGRDKIVTIEDPVEYQLPGVLQIPVNDKKGLTFARGLRSILRHDPDKIMVGEIRDRETAEIAVQSALTGHLVMTTVHANNVFDVFGRFTYMGIDPYSFVSALAGIWAQRLLRVNCPRCSVPIQPSTVELKRAGISSDDISDYFFRKGVGCGDCRGTGFRGRKAVAEVLMLNDEIRELIVEKRSIRQIKEAARRNGTRSLYEASLALVASGETTLEEVSRVTLAT